MRSLIVIVLTAVNIAGLRVSAKLQNVMSVLLSSGLLLVVVAGFIAPAAASAPPAAPTNGVPALFGTALLFVLFTYGGWNDAAYISAEVKGGNRAIVKVLVASLLVITAVYLLFVAALVAGLGFEGLKASKQVAADVAQKAFGSFGEKSIGAIVALATLTSINATMLVTARTNYSLGKDWQIFAFMSRWNAERDAPIVALLTTSVISIANRADRSRKSRRCQVYGGFHSTGVLVVLSADRDRLIRSTFSVPSYCAAVQSAAVSDSADSVRRDMRVPTLSKPSLYFRESGDPSCHLRDAVGHRRLAGRSAKEICVTRGTAPTNAAIVGILLAAGLGERYDPTRECSKLLQPVSAGRHVGTPIVAAAVRNLKDRRLTHTRGCSAPQRSASAALARSTAR